MGFGRTPDASLATTVIIPVKNGGPLLARCLDAVLAQQTSFPFGVLCIDSGSTDRSVDLIRERGVRLHQIDPREFGHGRTRNLGVSLCATPFVALITQDAIPADEHWLEELIRPFRHDDTLAGVFGAHLPHEGCRPAERYMLERHFSQFGAENVTWKIGTNPRTWADYEKHKQAICFFSDNNAALRRATWEQIPYADVEFMEDQLWATAVLEAGWGKAWAPRAAVRHSHNYDVGTTLRRAFDESRFRRLYLDPEESWPLTKWLEHARTITRRDQARLKQEAPPVSAGEVPLSILRQHADALGRFLGDRSPLIPPTLVRRLSQHVELKGRPDDAPQRSLAGEARAAAARIFTDRGTIDGTAELVHQAIHVWKTSRGRGLGESLLAWRRQTSQAQGQVGWWTGAAYQYLEKPAGPLLKDRAQLRGERLRLNWVVPAFGEGGGGHLNIFRMIHLLEQRGIESRVFVLDGEKAMPLPSARLRALVHEWFAPIEASVEPLRHALPPADFAIATHWSTAYAVRALGNCLVPTYFVQDYEPLFYPAGAEAVLAEQTYRLGFHVLAAGAWLGHMMREKFGLTTAEFPLAVDHELYWPEPGARVPGAPPKVFAYIRPHTPRRAFELVALALRRVKEARPQVEIHAAGAVLRKDMLPFDFVAHGILNGPRLRALYSGVTLGVSPSLTNYSLLPQEMAACGCPVVDLDGENTRAVYPPGAVVLAEPTVEGLAKEILHLLDDEQARQAQVERGLSYARSLTWAAAADSVEAALRSWVPQAAELPAPVPFQRASGRRSSG